MLLNMYEAVEKMEKLGGSFSRSIAKAWITGDMENKMILEKSFLHLFENYGATENIDDLSKLKKKLSIKLEVMEAILLVNDDIDKEHIKMVIIEMQNIIASY